MGNFDWIARVHLEHQAQDRSTTSVFGDVPQTPENCMGTFMMLFLFVSTATALMTFFVVYNDIKPLSESVFTILNETLPSNLTTFETNFLSPMDELLANGYRKSNGDSLYLRGIQEHSRTNLEPHLFLDNQSYTEDIIGKPIFHLLDPLTSYSVLYPTTNNDSVDCENMNITQPSVASRMTLGGKTGCFKCKTCLAIADLIADAKNSWRRHIFEVQIDMLTAKNDLKHFSLTSSTLTPSMQKFLDRMHEMCSDSRVVNERLAIAYEAIAGEIKQFSLCGLYVLCVLCGLSIPLGASAFAHGILTGKRKIGHVTCFFVEIAFLLALILTGVLYTMSVMIQDGIVTSFDQNFVEATGMDETLVFSDTLRVPPHPTSATDDPDRFNFAELYNTPALFVLENLTTRSDEALIELFAWNQEFVTDQYEELKQLALVDSEVATPYNQTLHQDLLNSTIQQLMDPDSDGELVTANDFLEIQTVFNESWRGISDKGFELNTNIQIRWLFVAQLYYQKQKLETYIATVSGYISKIHPLLDDLVIKTQAMENAEFQLKAPVEFVTDSIRASKIADCNFNGNCAWFRSALNKLFDLFQQMSSQNFGAPPAPTQQPPAPFLREPTLYGGYGPVQPGSSRRHEFYGLNAQWHGTDAVQCRGASIPLQGTEKIRFSESIGPVHCVYMQEAQRKGWREVGRTETINNTPDPTFAKSFQVDFFFEEVQRLRVEVFDRDSSSERLSDHDFLGCVEITMGQLMSSKGQSAVLKLLQNDNGRGRVHNLSGHVVIDAEEVVMNNCDPKWRHATISVQNLCNGDLSRLLKIECMDWEKNGKHQFIGSCTVKAAEFVTGELRSMNLINRERQARKGKRYKNSGVLILEQIEMFKQHTFAEYLRGGCEVSLIVGIDYTASNGSPSDPSSLHYMGGNYQGQMNDYQAAITATGAILEPYDSDKRFPVYGFGGLVNGVVDHCFPLTYDPSQPEVEGIGGIMKAYSDSFQFVQLHGPTKFAPLVHQAAAIARTFSAPAEQGLGEISRNIGRDSDTATAILQHEGHQSADAAAASRHQLLGQQLYHVSFMVVENSTMESSAMATVSKCAYISDLSSKSMLTSDDCSAMHAEPKREADEVLSADVVISVPSLVRVVPENSTNDSSDVPVVNPSPRLDQSLRPNLVALGLVLSYVAVSILVFHYTEDWSIVDCVYYAMVIVTTVGYGDVVPITNAGKAITIFFAFYGICTIGVALGQLASWFLQRQKHVTKMATQRLLSNVENAAATATGSVLDKEAKIRKMDKRKTRWKRFQTSLPGWARKIFSDSNKALFHAFVPIIISIMAGLIVAQLKAGRSWIASTTLWSVMKTKISMKELLDMDADGDGKVSQLEYLCYMLVKLNKADQDDIDGIIAQFHKLDRDGSGELDRDDLERLDRELQRQNKEESSC
ncbi:EF-Hand 1, calcium-binding site [Phytophthora cactorum]|nr:EF-Hand 1, calcium-binding site [Phytophthora cactorum]